jgi:hypothetical protein
LNRTEYANVIRDLLDLEIDPGKYLPVDDSTHGFDNIAGALGLSSTLVESYVSAAAKISRLAMGDVASPSLVVFRAPEDASQDYHVLGMPMGTRGGLLVKHIFPSDGEYVLEIRPIFGDNMSPTGFGTVPCEKVMVLLDNERIQLLDWQGGGRGGGGNANCAGRNAAGAGAGPRGGGNGANAGAAAGGQAPAADAAAPAPAAAGAPAGQGGQAGAGQGAGQGGGQGGGGGRNGGGGGMRVRFKATAGQHSLAVTFLQTNLAPILDIDIHPMRDTVQTGPTPGYTFFPHVGTLRLEGPLNATAAKDSASRRRIFICTPASPAEEATCAKKIITNLASQAYRRPVTADDISSLVDFYQSGRQEGNSFDSGIESALSRILADPKFIYRMEVEPATVKPGQSYRITDLELASRLSFFLWSTRPDTELINLATQGKLKDPVVLDQQVRRMLKDPRSEALAINFAGQWLNLRGMQAVGPLPLLYPNFDDPLRQAERKEVELLFGSIINEDRNIVDLLTADYTYVNERLAKHYGIKGIYGSQFRRITLGPRYGCASGIAG